VPETCLDRFVDLKGLIEQVSEERVWDYLGKQSSPGINFLGWGLGSYLSAAFLILMVICFALSAALGSGLLRLKNWARLTSIVLAAMSVLGAASQVPSAFSRLSPVLILFFAIRGAIDIWILIYFLRPEVEQAFGAAR
jgi:hypothetical protein